MISFLCRVIILLAVIVAYSKTAANLLNKINLHTSKSLVTSTSIDKLVDIKGGKIKPKAKSKSKKDSGNNKLNTKKKGLGLKEQLDQIKPATRIYLLLSLFCTLVHVSGLPAPAILSISATKWYELWRPFTSMAYFGAPSLSVANSIYFLVRYGQQLETLSGTGEHAWFLLVQTVILSVLGALLQFPFLAQAMSAATVYASCRLNPLERMPFQFGLIVTAWQLPYCMLAIDCLAQQNPAAAWPHLLGILSGHTYFFFTSIWPTLGGKKRLSAPKWFIDKLGGKPTSNVEGLNLKKTDSKSSSKSVAKRKSKKFGSIATSFSSTNP